MGRIAGMVVYAVIKQIVKVVMKFTVLTICTALAYSVIMYIIDTFMFAGTL